MNRGELYSPFLLWYGMFFDIIPLTIECASSSEDRVLVSGTKGRRFDSCLARHFLFIQKTNLQPIQLEYLLEVWETFSDFFSYKSYYRWVA